MDQITNVLQNYSQSGGATTPNQGEVEQHFNQVAQAAPPSDMANSIASMFRSDQTPPFGQLVSQLFGNSNDSQRANLINTLLASGAGAGLLSQLAKSAGISLPAGGGGQITPEDASKITPEMVQQAAAHAEQHDPSIVDRVSQIYAQHPTLIKTLGVAAMSMAMSHMASRR
ncbi:MAG: hypothetical protein M3119_00790 [Verrucomicrobiota bacterium]|nr:hypothetical protein [Verrucomicrobiota bacterium]